MSPWASFNFDSNTWLSEQLALRLLRFSKQGGYPMTPEAPVETVLVCSQCGRALPHSELVQVAGNWLCADCKPAFLSRLMASGAVSPLGWRYGGFWIRFGARM